MLSCLGRGFNPEAETLTGPSKEAWLYDCVNSFRHLDQLEAQAKGPKQHRSDAAETVHSRLTEASTTDVVEAHQMQVLASKRLAARW